MCESVGSVEDTGAGRTLCHGPREATAQVHTQIPRIEGDESELVVLGQDVPLCEGIKTVDGIAEGARIADLVPSEGGQACCRYTSANCNAAALECFDLLHNAVMGVFTGFTRTLSR